jgi:alpha-L-fucosidase
VKGGKKPMSSYVTKKTPGDTEWFRHDRFGMFIHFGLYAMPARHEWIKKREAIPARSINFVYISKNKTSP